MPGQTLALIIDAFDTHGVEHMLAGSFASSLHGLPRTTNDIDLVVKSTVSAMRAACSRLDRDRFLIDDHDLERAVRQRDMSNILDMSTGWKVDVIVLKDRPFSASEFGRRVRSRVLDTMKLLKKGCVPSAFRRASTPMTEILGSCSCKSMGSWMTCCSIPSPITFVTAKKASFSMAIPLAP